MVEAAKGLVLDFMALQNRVNQFAWVVETQEEDLFEALVKLAKVKEDMANHSSRFPAEKDTPYDLCSGEYRESWSKLCSEQGRLVDKLSEIGKQFREAKDST
jgi:hypothetical protein